MTPVAALFVPIRLLCNNTSGTCFVNEILRHSRVTYNGAFIDRWPRARRDFNDAGRLMLLRLWKSEDNLYRYGANLSNRPDFFQGSHQDSFVALRLEILLSRLGRLSPMQKCARIYSAKFAYCFLFPFPRENEQGQFLRESERDFSILVTMNPSRVFLT